MMQDVGWMDGWMEETAYNRVARVAAQGGWWVRRIVGVSNHQLVPRRLPGLACHPFIHSFIHWSR